MYTKNNLIVHINFLDTAQFSSDYESNCCIVLDISRQISDPFQFLEDESGSGNRVSLSTHLEYSVCNSYRSVFTGKKANEPGESKMKGMVRKLFYLFYHFYTKWTFGSMINKQGCWFFGPGFH